MTEQEIIAKLFDPNIPLDEVTPYFRINEDQSQPFGPAFELAPQYRDSGPGIESALGLNLLNRAARFKRQSRFQVDRLSRPNDIRLISNGDSWFLHPLLSDVINHLYKRHLIFSLDGAGDELNDITREREIHRLVPELRASGVLLSGGGNDLLAGGSLSEILKSAASGSPADSYIDQATLASKRDSLIKDYKRYVGEILTAHQTVHVFVHGYDHAQPVHGGRWLGQPMKDIVPPALQDDVISVVVNDFNDHQIALVAELRDKFGERVHHVDVRGTVRGRWADELHPDDKGYGAVSDLFDEAIKSSIHRRLAIPGSALEGAMPEVAGAAVATANIPLGLPGIDDLDPLPPHMLAPVDETPATLRRRQAEQVNTGAAIQQFDGGERDNFRLPEVGGVEVVLGEIDFRPARFLRDGAERAKAICRVTRRIGGTGTGSLLKGGFIFTNWHVLPTADVARGSVAEFGFEDGGTVVTAKLDADRFFLANKARDFAIVACDMSQLGGIQPLVLSLSPNRFVLGDRVNIIQHPDGRPKEVAFRDNKIIDVFAGAFHYRCDTEPGSSGSPVFNDSWDLIGLHRAGKAGEFNQAIRIDAIAAFLEANQRANGPLAAPEVSTIVSGTSPHLGFFGRAGIIEAITPEVEVPTFQGSAEFADIGFWNIENFFGGVSSARIERIAKLLADINMDALGLIEVGLDELKRTRDLMRNRGENVDFVFLNASQGQRDLAVLFDRDTTKVEMLDDIADRHSELLNERIEGKTVFHESLFSPASKSRTMMARRQSLSWQ